MKDLLNEDVMEMHDSVVLQYERCSDGTGFILLRAVVYRSDGQGAIDPGESKWQNIRMTFTDMLIESSIPDHKPYAVDGYLFVNGVKDDGLIPFPSRLSGEVIYQWCLAMSSQPQPFTLRAF